MAKPGGGVDAWVVDADRFEEEEEQLTRSPHSPFGTARPREDLLAEKGLDLTEMEDQKTTSSLTSLHSSDGAHSCCPSGSQVSAVESEGASAARSNVNPLRPCLELDEFHRIAGISQEPVQFPQEWRRNPPFQTGQVKAEDWRKTDHQLVHRASITRPEPPTERILKDLKVAVIRTKKVILRCGAPDQVSSVDAKGLWENLSQTERMIELLASHLNVGIRAGQTSGSGTVPIFSDGTHMNSSEPSEVASSSQSFASSSQSYQHVLRPDERPRMTKCPSLELSSNDPFFPKSPSPSILFHSFEDHRHIMISHSDTYGTDGIQESITAHLLSSRNEDDLSIIAIVARSGAGKATLVRLIYHDQRVKDAFGTRLWVRMSDKFDERMLMTAIIEQKTQVQCDVRDLQLLVEHVKGELTNKKFLLVLENAVGDNQSVWSNALEHLNVGAEGSSIIITTTREIVSFSRTKHFYLSPLQDKDCFSICQQYACDENHDPSRHPSLVNFSKIIPYKCGGNPLHVKAACALLCHADNIFKLLDYFNEESLQDLEFCYSVLPLHLKLCLQFCSLFPKEYVYDQRHLVQLWMSQGFINCDKCGEIEGIGTEYFNELLCRSFFNCSPLHDDKDGKYVMHGLFHDMITSVSMDSYIRLEDHLSKMPERTPAACHLSLVPWESQSVFALESVTREELFLDTFLVINRSELQHTSMSSPFLKLVGLDDFFLKFESLKTLNLSFTFIGQLPASIGNLKQLRYLAVNNTDLKHLPCEICSLDNLQTLEARNCAYLLSLPENIRNLKNLRHLDVRKQPGYVRMPSGIGQLVHLQTLPVLNVGGDSSYCSIWELRDLDNLRGDLALTGLENVKVGYKVAKLINKKYLKALTLEWSDNDIDLEEDNEEISSEIFESLQPPSDLETLTVRNYCGSLFPVWIEKAPYDSLQSITLDSCYNCCMLPALGDLQSLKYLCLRRMYALKTFGYSHLPENRSCGKFPALELLKLWEMYELDGWAGVNDGDFPHLHNVSICGCPSLKSLPCVPSLVDLSLHRCDQLPEIPELLNLKSLKIEGFQDIVSLDLPQGLPVLKNLEIIRCNKLVSLIGLSTLSSIEKLKIVKCPNLDVVNNWQQYHFKKIKTSRDATVIST